MEASGAEPVTLSHVIGAWGRIPIEHVGDVLGRVLAFGGLVVVVQYNGSFDRSAREKGSNSTCPKAH